MLLPVRRYSVHSHTQLDACDRVYLVVHITRYMR